MKKILYIIILLLMVCCTNQNTGIESQEYDWEALRDTLGLDSTVIFVKELSPLYKDKYLYCKDPKIMLKTMFYKIYYDEYDCRLDTIVWAVTRNNETYFVASNRQHATVSSWGWTDDVWETIEQCIKNREKCYLK